MAPRHDRYRRPRRLRLGHIWRFSASEYCRRFVAPACLVSTKLLVDTCSASSAIRRSLRQSALSGRRPSPSAYQRQEWSSGAPADWATEAFALARSDAYGLLPRSGDRDTYSLSPAYLDQAGRDVALQLSRAGVRLAYVLNQPLP